jgi:ribosomal protein S12 methylthiotransferase accessory factor
MSEITFIKGKDESLEKSIQSMQSILQKQGLQIEQADWLNPAENIFSLHIYEKTCRGLFTNGKGASRKATLASALGEYLERLSTNYFFSDYYLQQTDLTERDWLYYPNEKVFSLDQYKDCLTDSLWQLYDPHKELTAEHLLSFNDDYAQIRALPLIEAQSKQTVYFPVNLLSNLYASNGLCAGNTPTEARVQGLSEVFERWVKNKILKENISLPYVPDKVLQRFPSVQASIQSLQKQGMNVMVRDASLGGRFPVINVTLLDCASGRCFASFGAHPIFEVALERTLTESLQGRHLHNLDGFDVPTFDQSAVVSAENLENHFIDSSGLIHARFIANQADYEFVDWNWEQTSDEMWQWMVNQVAELGYQVYYADYDQYGFHASRILVPGMSEVYPLDELLMKNQNDGRKLRIAMQNFEVDQNPQTVLDCIEEVGFSDHEGVASMIGLMPDADSPWSKLKICDLRFWLQMAAKDWAGAYDSLYSTLAYVDPNSEWKKVYEAFRLALDIQLDDLKWEVYLAGLNALFGEQTVARVKAHLDGTEQAWGLCFGRSVFENSGAHQAMWRIYNQTRQAKQSE